MNLSPEVSWGAEGVHTPKKAKAPAKKMITKFEWNLNLKWEYLHRLQKELSWEKLKAASSV